MDGVIHPDFIPVAQTLRRQIENYRGGAAACVYHRGECVVDLWGGYRNRNKSAWDRDTMSPSFSTTKGVASTLIHIMVDRGLLDYDTRVAEYWPEFAQAGKENITLRQVLAHQSGLYHIRQMIDHADRMLDWEHMVRQIELTEPAHTPGERTGYHGLTYGFLVGEILQRVTGIPFPKLVQAEIAEPLGLDGMYIGAPREALPRAAELIWPGPVAAFQLSAAVPTPRWLTEAGQNASALAQMALQAVGLDVDLVSIFDALAPRGISSFDFGARETLAVSIPAANGLFTARSLARMYAALANGGELDGTRLLSAETLGRATEIQAATAGRSVLPIDMRWRLGYHGIPTTRGFAKQGFGHFGFGGSGAWADPSKELAVALIVNCGMGTPLGDLRTARLSGAALSCARKRQPARRPRSKVRTPSRRRPRTAPTIVSSAGAP